MNSAIDSIYIVRAGDTLGKIAQRFYGDPNAYATILEQNNLSSSMPLQVGQKLVIPNTANTAQTLAAPQDEDTVPTAPAGSPVTAQTIETVTVTAQRPWYTDWRLWAGASALLGLWLVFSRREKSR